MTNTDLSPLVGEILSGVTDTMVEEAAGLREEPLEEAPKPELEATDLPADWRATISNAGYEFIVRWETGGKSYYEKIIKGRPVWPGYASGITIGCGFDLGYHSEDDYSDQWKTRLGAADFGRLRTTVGFRTVPPNRDQKVAKARALVHSLSDIVVPWITAIEQFDNAKLPKLIGDLYGALDHLDRLSPHCRAALLSLVFNRGPAFRLDSERFSEMREVRTAMRAGSTEEFQRIPELLRSMKRIWGANSSLAERREGEAKLFEAGLKEMDLLESVESLVAMGEIESPNSELESALVEGAEERHDDFEVEPSDDANEADSLAIEESAELESPLSPASVRWNPNDDEQPDYRHLNRTLAGSTSEIRPADLECLIEANEFAVRPGKIIFALRGAALVGGDAIENTDSFSIKDQRPDHRTFRCIIGVYDPSAGRLWAYRASTVPNAAYVYKCCAMARAGTPVGGLTGNILPTGCYTYTVGTHKKGRPGEIPGVLRLSTTSTGASQVLVLRSLMDVVYDRFDRFTVSIPADNIHPGILSSGFSSAGCLTIPGRFAHGVHQGSWGKFREAAGLDAGGDGTQYSVLVLTGLDALMAAAVRTGTHDGDQLRRLRHGSKGDRVAKLQAALGLAPDTSQLLGPVTRNALVKKQSTVLAWADGIYSPDMDARLGFGIYAQTS